MRKTLEEKLKQTKYRQEVLDLFKQAVANSTSEEFEIINEKLDRILVCLEMLLKKLDKDNQHFILDAILPHRAES